MSNGYLETGVARNGTDERDPRDVGAESGTPGDAPAQVGLKHLDSAGEPPWMPAERRHVAGDGPTSDLAASEPVSVRGDATSTPGAVGVEAICASDAHPGAAGALENRPPVELVDASRHTVDSRPDAEEPFGASNVIAAARPDLPVEAVEPAAFGSQPAERRRHRAIFMHPVRAGLVFVVIAAVSAVAFVVAKSGDALPADAAFRVDGRVVTQNGLDRRVHVLGALYGVTAPTDPQKLDAFRRDTAKALVLSIVMDDAARRHGVVIADKVVSDVLDRVISERYPQGGRGAFVKALAVQGISEQDVLGELRRQLAVRQLYDQVTSGITVSEAAARADFLAHPEKYQPPQQRHLRELVVADEPTARTILAKVKAGSSFAALARSRSLDASTRSSGGDLGTVTAAELDPAFASMAFSAAKGKPFGPVQTSLGWYVGLVQDVLQPPAPTFDEVKEQVRQQLSSLAQVTAWRAFLQNRLKEGHVRYAAAYQPASPDALPAFGQGSGAAPPSLAP